MKKLNLDIQMFASTNKTTNYELPQFVGSDKPTWLGDFNSAMLAIDTGMATNASDIDELESDVATASATASQASTDVAGLTSTVNTLSGNVSTVTTTANNASTTATSALNTANTANGKADTNASAITGLDTRITALEEAEDVYSTTEVKTNKVWIDNKPIYRKVYSTSITGTSATINHNLSDVTITNFESHITNGTNTFSGNTWRANAPSAMFCYLSGTTINWSSGGDNRTGYTLYVTLEYTKDND